MKSPFFNTIFNYLITEFDKHPNPEGNERIIFPANINQEKLPLLVDIRA